jgi:hypothetical protein
MTLVRIGLILALAAAAAIVANLVLLGIASGAREPVGKLRFSTVLESTTHPPPAPPSSTTPTPPGHDRGEADDD